MLYILNLYIHCEYFLKLFFYVNSPIFSMVHWIRWFFCDFWNGVQFSSVQSLSCVWLFAAPWITARQASLSITSSQGLLKLMSIESVMHPSHPLLSPSPPALNLSQHQGLFKWVSSSNQVAKVLEWMNTQDWSPLGWMCWISLQSKGLSRVFSNATIQKHHWALIYFLSSTVFLLTSLYL